MKEIKELVTRLSGHRNKSGYALLCCAVEAACRHQPCEPKMKIILAEANELMGDGTERKQNTLSKVMSRVVNDIWESGDRSELERIFGKKVLERPTPRELVFRLAEYVWKSGEAA